MSPGLAGRGSPPCDAPRNTTARGRVARALVAAAPPAIPAPLVEQLAVGGKLFIPVGSSAQELRVLTKTRRGVTSERLLEVRFVPMTGRAQQDE